MLDEMRMSTACFARAPQRYTSHLSKHFLFIFQEVTPLSKTRNQLNLSNREERGLTPARGRTTLLAEAEESRISVLWWPIFLLMPPGLPFGFERVDIPPKGEGFGPFVGRGLQAHLKEVQLFFLVLQFGVNRQALFGLKDLEHHPLDGPAFFFQLHAYPEPSPCRIVIDLLHCWF